ncbi:hypothetical protein [Colwellia sp. E150_009]
MTSKWSKLFTFSEQIGSSGFNFIIIVILSKIQSENVALFGLMYSFSLVYIALLKNGALNFYLTNGNKSVKFFLYLIRIAIINLYSNCFIFFLICFSLLTAPELGLYIPVFLFYIAIEINRVYLFSVHKEFVVLCVNSSCYVSILGLIYLFSIEVNVAFFYGVLIQLLTFMFIYFNRFKLADEYHIDKHNFDKIGRDSFLLTASYSTYAHGPLWLLYAINDDLAKLLIQIRNIFQPVQMLSRVVDMYEKRRSGSGEYSYLIFKNNFKFQVYCSALFSAICALIGYFAFEYIYGEYDESNLLLLIVIYSLVCILTFLSKPVETYFYKIKNLKPIIKSRMIASILIVLTCPFLFLFQSEYSLILLLLALNIIWSVIIILNFITINKLANSKW